MRIRKRKSTKSLLVVNLLLAISLISATSFCFAKNNISKESWLETKLSIDCNGRNLQDVLVEISGNLEIEILYDAKLAQNIVNCKYEKSNVESILDRLFKDYNKVLIIDNAEKNIIVRVFGTTKYMLASRGINAGANTIPFLENITEEELAELQTTQLQDYRQQLSSEDTIIPGVNISNGELKYLHEEQYSDYQQQIDDKNRIVPGVNISAGDLKEIQEKQFEHYKNTIEDENAIVANIGISHGELKTLQENQYKAYKEELNDPNAIVPGFGITRAELIKNMEQSLKR